jgi:glucose/arabinose dehydrogenase
LGDADGDHTVPEGNYFSDAALPEIWAYGLRNPFRANVDGCTGDVFIGDVGLDSFEEVNVLRPSDSGVNFGWPLLEGNRCWEDDCAGPYASPAYQYATAASGGAIVGGSVYRGASIPALRGRYLFADASSGRVWSAVYDKDEGKLGDVVDHTLELTLPVITSIENDNLGELYFTSRVERSLYRLEAFE